jgi:hypothetical protein
MIRAATSVDPPGGNGTISVMGREGKLSVRANGALKLNAIKANATAATAFRMIPIPPEECSPDRYYR